ncbi:hypothetical protein BBJ29_002187 [Phytophthora kernoviae]|uniref:Uncharacterized protein n=1 Tax=Phytophthora kernoviae TaxID=325452 RepID=A0A3F2RV30_9STRA|nr:hypothetical protein BBJ29_002187 [Phytophthora kernoviae]RLN64785.1 hypothetical protein BBP00_00003232 [Phytophthora kernoviae]
MYKRLCQYEYAKEFLLGHCSEIYQPLKKFMLQNLKHVRYVRPPRGWNDGDVRIFGSKQPFQDLIAGFTPVGVLYIRDAMATDGIKAFSSRMDVHLGGGCDRDWYQLVPKEIEGALGKFCDCYDFDADSDCDPYTPREREELGVPYLFDARVKLLEAMNLLEKGIVQHCSCALQLVDFDDHTGFRFGTSQSVIISLTAALEAKVQDRLPVNDAGVQSDGDRGDGEDSEEGEEETDLWDEHFDWEAEQELAREARKCERQLNLQGVKQLRAAASEAKLKPVNTNNKGELTRLINSVENGVGARFF